MQRLRIAETQEPSPAVKKSLLSKVARILPGVIAGAADLDPAAVLTATVAGASFGRLPGWVVLLSVTLLLLILLVVPRIGGPREGRVHAVPRHSRQQTALVVALLVVALHL